jgi:hypothetical protein
MYAPLISGNIGTCSYDVSIGSRYTNSDGFNKYFKGYIDDVAIFDEALSQEDVFNVMTLGAVFFLETPTIPLDIKPGSCPNPVNVKSKGVLPVAILGTEEFDASTIDPASVRLNDIEPIRSSLEDVGAPLTDPNECECTTDGPDGFIDLSLKFKTQDIVESLGEVNTDDILMLPLTGVLNDGTSIEGEDCILIVGRFKPLNKADINGDGFVNAVDMAIVAENWLESSLIDN